MGNPVYFIDPTGMGVEGEFEWNKENREWEKTSTKGDEIGVDFYHMDADENHGQRTYVTDREGGWNIINNGREALQGKSRGDNVNYKTIYDEWSEGTGPARSVFEGDHPANTRMGGLWDLYHINHCQILKKLSMNPMM
jgi:hypothetical protein